MKLRHDTEADAVYIELRDVPYAFGHHLDYERHIDYAAAQTPRGIELLGVSHGVRVDDLPEREAVARLLEEHGVRVVTGAVVP